MAEFIESSDFSFTFVDNISALTEYTFNGKLIRQFIISVDVECTVTWKNNIGTYTIKAGETLAVPVRTTKVSITPTAPCEVRLIGIG